MRDSLRVMTMTHTRALGHLALYYAPGDMEASRRLLQDLGCTLVENGPRPGEDGFCTVLLDDRTATHADNLLFLAPLTPAQQALERAIREQFGATEPDDPSTAFTDMKRHSPETASHFAIRYQDLEMLERALQSIEADTAEGGPLHGRAELTKYRARPNLDPDVDARMAASPAFTGGEDPAFANYWIQCFVKTDLFGYGILAFGQTIELDYIFDPFFAEPPKFGR
jgi:hypothetical protein